LGCHFTQGVVRETCRKKLVEGEQAARGVAASSAKAGRDGDVFLQFEVRTRTRVASPEKEIRRSDDKIFFGGAVNRLTGTG
jgi:hypothetical protein